MPEPKAETALPAAPASAAKARPSAAPALDRGLEVLSFLREKRSAAVAEVSANLRIPPASAYRLLNTLERRRFVVKDMRSGQYRLGSQILLLAGAMLAGLDLRALAHPYLQELFERFKETVELTLLESEQVVVIDKVEGEESVHILDVGGHRSPFYDSTGFCLLTSLPPHQVEAAVRRHQDTQQRELIFGLRKLEGVLETIRREGFMADDGPAYDRFNRRSRRIAAPIQDHVGRVRGAVGIVVAVSRWDPDRNIRLTRALKKNARRISELLGFRGQVGQGEAAPLTP